MHHPRTGGYAQLVLYPSYDFNPLCVQSDLCFRITCTCNCSTHKLTVELLAKNKNYGMLEGQVTCFQQEMVVVRARTYLNTDTHTCMHIKTCMRTSAPQIYTLTNTPNPQAMEDKTGKFSMDETLIRTKPHGHGDVHLTLLQSGTAERWMQQVGRC